MAEAALRDQFTLLCKEGKAMKMVADHKLKEKRAKFIKNYHWVRSGVIGAGLRNNDFLVMNYLFNFSGGFDLMYPAQETIGDAVGLSRNTVGKTLKGLSKLGLVSKGFRKGKTCFYAITELGMRFFMIGESPPELNFGQVDLHKFGQVETGSCTNLGTNRTNNFLKRTKDHHNAENAATQHQHSISIYPRGLELSSLPAGPLAKGVGYLNTPLLNLKNEQPYKNENEKSDIDNNENENLINLKNDQILDLDNEIEKNGVGCIGLEVSDDHTKNETIYDLQNKNSYLDKRTPVSPPPIGASKLSSADLEITARLGHGKNLEFKSIDMDDHGIITVKFVANPRCFDSALVNGEITPEVCDQQRGDKREIEKGEDMVYSKSDQVKRPTLEEMQEKKQKRLRQKRMSKFGVKSVADESKRLEMIEKVKERNRKIMDGNYQKARQHLEKKRNIFNTVLDSFKRACDRNGFPSVHGQLLNSRIELMIKNYGVDTTILMVDIAVDNWRQIDQIVRGFTHRELPNLSEISLPFVCEALFCELHGRGNQPKISKDGKTADQTKKRLLNRFGKRIDAKNEEQNSRICGEMTKKFKEQCNRAKNGETDAFVRPTKPVVDAEEMERIRLAKVAEEERIEANRKRYQDMVLEEMKKIKC